MATNQSPGFQRERIRFEHHDDGLLIEEAPALLSRFHQLGQGVIIQGVSYEVCKVRITENGQEERTEIVSVRVHLHCRRCGGLAGKRTPPDECVCGESLS